MPQVTGCAIFSNIQDVHVFHTARRFTDCLTPIQGMRTPGRKRLNGKLTGEVGEEVDTENPNFSPENFIAEMHNGSLVTTAVSVRAKAEAKRDCRTISICQHWINQQNIEILHTGLVEMVQMFHSHSTQKLPSICRLYTEMRVV